MVNNSLSEIAKVLQSARRVAVISHYNPDPDAYGSSGGLAIALRRAGKEVCCINEDGLLPRYAYIPGTNQILQTPPAEPADVVVVCDCGEIGRVGDSLVRYVRAAACVVNLDHHVSNDYFGHLNLVKERSSSTSEIVLEVLEQGGFDLSAETAQALMIGIIADTGSFRYSSVSPQTFRAAGRLAENGARADMAAQMVYGSQGLDAVRLHAEAVLNLRLHCDGQVSEILITEEMLARHRATRDDTENLVEKGRDIEGVKLSFLARQDPGIWKLSLRSKDEAHDVSTVARHFGGGGHKCAAAFRWRGSMEDLRPLLIEKLTALLQLRP